MTILPSPMKPAHDRLEAFLAGQRRQPFSYSEVGATRQLSHSSVSSRYNIDVHRVALGRGSEVFDAAARAIRHWRMFPPAWTTIRPAHAAIEPGTVVATSARAFGLWWTNACRIVYVVDEIQPARRFGFAYGTLPAHVESGEELFCVTWADDDVVWYELSVFSRPRAWFTRLGYPLMRRLQRRFVADSQRAMLAAVGATGADLRSRAVQ